MFRPSVAEALSHNDDPSRRKVEIPTKNILKYEGSMYYEVPFMNSHPQLRNLLASNHAGRVYIAVNKRVFCIHLSSGSSELIAEVSFAIKCLSANDDWIAVGGEHHGNAAFIRINPSGPYAVPNRRNRHLRALAFALTQRDLMRPQTRLPLSRRQQLEYDYHKQNIKRDSAFFRRRYPSPVEHTDAVLPSVLPAHHAFLKDPESARTIAHVAEAWHRIPTLNDSTGADNAILPNNTHSRAVTHQMSEKVNVPFASYARRIGRPQDYPFAPDQYRALGGSILNALNLFRLRSPLPDCADEDVAVAANNDKSVTVYSVTRYANLYRKYIGIKINNGRISPNQKTMVCIGDGPYIYIFSVAVDEVSTYTVDKFLDGEHHRLIAPDQYGKRLVSWTFTPRSKIKMVTWPDECKTTTSYFPGLNAFPLAFNDSSTMFAIGNQNGHIFVYDLAAIEQHNAELARIEKHESREDRAARDFVDDAYARHHQLLISWFLTSQRVYEGGAVRALAFSPPPWDLLAWTEHNDNFGVADLRTGCLRRQVLPYDKTEGMVRVIGLDMRRETEGPWADPRRGGIQTFDSSDDHVSEDDDGGDRDSHGTSRSGLPPGVESALLEAQREASDGFSTRLRSLLPATLRPNPQFSPSSFAVPEGSTWQPAPPSEPPAPPRAPGQGTESQIQQAGPPANNPAQPTGQELPYQAQQAHLHGAPPSQPSTSAQRVSQSPAWRHPPPVSPLSPGIFSSVVPPSQPPISAQEPQAQIATGFQFGHTSRHFSAPGQGPDINAQVHPHRETPPLRTRRGRPPQNDGAGDGPELARPAIQAPPLSSVGEASGGWLAGDQEQKLPVQDSPHDCEDQSALLRPRCPHIAPVYPPSPVPSMEPLPPAPRPAYRQLAVMPTPVPLPGSSKRRAVDQTESSLPHDMFSLSTPAAPGTQTMPAGRGMAATTATTGASNQEQALKSATVFPRSASHRPRLPAWWFKPRRTQRHCPNAQQAPLAHNGCLRREGLVFTDASACNNTTSDESTRSQPQLAPIGSFSVHYASQRPGPPPAATNGCIVPSAGTSDAAHTGAGMQQQTNGVASDHHAHAHPPTSFNGTSFVNGIGNGNPSIFFYGTNLTNGTGEAPTNGTNGEPRTNGTNGVPRTNGTDGESPTNGTDGVPLTNGVNGVSHANGTSGGPLTNGTYGDGRARETNQVAGTIAMAQHDGPTDYATLHGGLPLPMHASLGCALTSGTRPWNNLEHGCGDFKASPGRGSIPTSSSVFPQRHGHSRSGQRGRTPGDRDRVVFGTPHQHVPEHSNDHGSGHSHPAPEIKNEAGSNGTSVSTNGQMQIMRRSRSASDKMNRACVLDAYFHRRYPWLANTTHNFINQLATARALHSAQERKLLPLPYGAMPRLGLSGSRGWPLYTATSEPMSERRQYQNYANTLLGRPLTPLRLESSLPSNDIPRGIGHSFNISHGQYIRALRANNFRNVGAEVAPPVTRTRQQGPVPVPGVITASNDEYINHYPDEEENGYQDTAGRTRMSFVASRNAFPDDGQPSRYGVGHQPRPRPAIANYSSRTVQLPRALTTEGLGWSPDGRKLYVGVESGILEFPLNVEDRLYFTSQGMR